MSLDAIGPASLIAKLRGGEPTAVGWVGRRQISHSGEGVSTLLSKAWSVDNLGGLDLNWMRLLPGGSDRASMASRPSIKV